MSLRVDVSLRVYYIFVERITETFANFSNKGLHTPGSCGHQISCGHYSYIQKAHHANPHAKEFPIIECGQNKSMCSSYESRGCHFSQTLRATQ